MIVTNVSDKTLTNKSRQDWLKYWKHFSKSEYCYCSEANCTKKHHHGVLVKMTTQDNEKLYVVPLCENHSDGFQAQIEIDENVDVIPAGLCL